MCSAGVMVHLYGEIFGFGAMVSSKWCYFEYCLPCSIEVSEFSEKKYSENNVCEDFSWKFFMLSYVLWKMLKYTGE